jgi:phenylacetate-coenzyme A ligase PaaK-like adenylate-forming protein
MFGPFRAWERTTGDALMNLNADGLFLTTLRDDLRAARFPADQLQALQLRRLRTLLARAAQFVPLYRDRYRDHRDLVANLREPDDLWRLPAVSKEDYLRRGPSGYVDEREDLARLIRRTTSGSLGQALNLYATPSEATIHAALTWTGWMGQAAPNDRLFCMAAPYLEFHHQYLPNTFIPVQMSTADTRARFQEFQPTVVIGATEAIALLARDLRDNAVDERRQVRMIFPFGQTLTPALREMMRAGFDAAIFDLYGTNETFWIGCECEHHDGLHVPIDRVIVQIAKLNEPGQPAAPGELGEVIVTSLARWTTPFIRYRSGDAAVLDTAPCPCGRQTPRLKSLEGRIQDFLLSASGDWISPGALATDLAYGQEAILDHRIVQEAAGRVRVWIVPAPAFGDRERRHITDVLRRQLGPVEVVIERVEHIPRDPSGKRRRVYRAFATSEPEA